ncbi:hypothetical protein ROZALSC1DRAFT_25502, partial [Rozella allomycis CSF55]
LIVFTSVNNGCSICPVCSFHSDNIGDHAITCAPAERIRHNDIVRVSAAVIGEVGARVDLEPSRLFPDDKKRPDFTCACCWKCEFTAFDDQCLLSTIPWLFKSHEPT